jgi:hypothetical protein
MRFHRSCIVSCTYGGLPLRLSTARQVESKLTARLKLKQGNETRSTNKAINLKLQMHTHATDVPASRDSPSPRLACCQRAAEVWCRIKLSAWPIVGRKRRFSTILLRIHHLHMHQSILFDGSLRNFARFSYSPVSLTFPTKIGVLEQSNVKGAHHRAMDRADKSTHARLESKSAQADGDWVFRISDWLHDVETANYSPVPSLAALKVWRLDASSDEAGKCGSLV